MDAVQGLIPLVVAILAWGTTVNWRPRSTASALFLVACWLATIAAAAAALLAYADAPTRPR